MKYLLTLLIIFAGFVSTSAQNPSNPFSNTPLTKLDRAFLETKSLVESGEFKFVATWGYPQGNSQVSLSSMNNFMMIHENRVDAYLQYYGQVFTSRTAETNAGIVMNGTMEAWKVKYDAKSRNIDYRFSYKHNRELFDVILSISAQGGASMVVSSSKRDPIMYDGYVSEVAKSSG